VSLTRNGDVKESKKEVGSPLSETLFDYGVPSAAIAKTNIEIKMRVDLCIFF